jgi:hypothetical protein
MRLRSGQAFESAEVRVAQDDRSIFDRNIGDKTLDPDDVAQLLHGFRALFESRVFFRS